MRPTTMGLLAGAALTALLMLFCWQAGKATAQGPKNTALAETGTIIALNKQLGDGRQQVVLIDPKARVIGVYHISPTGQITLQGVRNAQYDLLMDEFNGVSPSPREIRSLLQR